jgi:predicted ester cyclase
VSQAANKAVVRAFIEQMMNGQHVDRIEEFVAPDAVHHERTADVNYRAALRDVFRDPKYGWEFVVDELIADGDKVAARCTASYVALGDRNELGVPYQPGTRATVWHAHIFRLADGKIVEHWPVREIWDAVKQCNAPVRDGRATNAAIASQETA